MRSGSPAFTLPEEQAEEATKITIKNQMADLLIDLNCNRFFLSGIQKIL